MRTEINDLSGDTVMVFDEMDIIKALRAQFPMYTLNRFTTRVSKTTHASIEVRTVTEREWVSPTAIAVRLVIKGD